MPKRQSLEDYIKKLDVLYQEQGIGALRDRSYTELGFLAMWKKNELEQVRQRRHRTNKPNPADARMEEMLERQRVEILGMFGTRVRETAGKEPFYSEIDEPEVERE